MPSLGIDCEAEEVEQQEGREGDKGEWCGM